MDNPQNKWNFYSWENHLFLWAIYTMAILNNQRVMLFVYFFNGLESSAVQAECQEIHEESGLTHKPTVCFGNR